MVELLLIKFWKSTGKNVLKRLTETISTKSRPHPHKPSATSSQEEKALILMWIRDRFLIHAVPELNIHVLWLGDRAMEWQCQPDCQVSTGSHRTSWPNSILQMLFHTIKSFILSLLSIIRPGLAKSFKTQTFTRFYLFVYICLAKTISFYHSCTNNHPQQNLHVAIIEESELYLMSQYTQNAHQWNVLHFTTHKFWTGTAFPKHPLKLTWKYSVHHQWTPQSRNFLKS